MQPQLTLITTRHFSFAPHINWYNSASQVSAEKLADLKSAYTTVIAKVKALHNTGAESSDSTSSPQSKAHSVAVRPSQAATAPAKKTAIAKAKATASSKPSSARLERPRRHKHRERRLNGNAAVRPHNSRYFKAAEDTQLIRLVEIHGAANWGLIAANFRGNKTVKQLKERYMNHLSPEISKAPFTVEEDHQLMAAIRKIGTRWTEISENFPGRPELALKNRYYGVLKRKLDARIYDDKNATVQEVEAAIRNIW